MLLRRPLLPALALLLLTAAGCRSVPVDVLAVDGPDSLRVAEPGTFRAVVNEDAKGPVTYAWSFDDGTETDGTPATHAFEAPGTYDVQVTAANRKGRSTDTETRPVVVYAPAEAATILSMRADPGRLDTRTTVRYEASVHGTDPIRYTWDFGDGTTGDGPRPTHVYERPGTYTVTLTAANAGGSDAQRMALTVQPYQAAICREVTDMGAVYFGRNSSILTEQATATLQENVVILLECPNLSVRIDGYAGPDERNADQLATDRARAVEQYYVDRSVAASRLRTLGHGRPEGLVSQKEGAERWRRADSTPLR